jgi:hypothetical protein
MIRLDWIYLHVCILTAWLVVMTYATASSINRLQAEVDACYAVASVCPTDGSCPGDIPTNSLLHTPPGWMPLDSRTVTELE